MGVSINELQDYAFCGLFHRYRYVFKLPHLPYVPEDVYEICSRRTVRNMLRDWGLRRKVFRKVLADASTAFEALMHEGSHKSLRHPEKMYELYAQGLLLIGNTANQIDLTKDVVAVTGLEHTVELSPGVTIEDEIDAIVIKNDVSRADRYYMLVTILDDVTQKCTSSKFESLHLGFARQAMLETMEPRLDRPIVHQFFSLKNVNKRQVITSAKDINTFKILAGKLIEGIQKKIFLPTAHVSKCRSCWFNKICEGSFAADQVPETQVERARKTLEAAKREALS